jgi:hypothetical protein
MAASSPQARGANNSTKRDQETNFTAPLDKSLHFVVKTSGMNTSSTEVKRIMTTENTKKPTTDHTNKPVSVPANNQKPQPARVFRQGAIAASVWQRQAATGFAYFDFSLSRSWKSTTSGKEGYSTNFFPQNCEAMAQVIQQASDWIIEQMAGPADTGKPVTPEARKAA